MDLKVHWRYFADDPKLYRIIETSIKMLKFYRRVSILSQTDLNLGYLSTSKCTVHLGRGDCNIYILYDQALGALHPHQNKKI